MFPPCRHQKRFFDNPHADNLYSSARLFTYHSKRDPNRYNGHLFWQSQNRGQDFSERLGAQDLTDRHGYADAEISHQFAGFQNRFPVAVRCGFA
jgi:hypothetical protein